MLPVSSVDGYFWFNGQAVIPFHSILYNRTTNSVPQFSLSQSFSRREKNGGNSRSASSDEAGAYYLAKTVLRGSVVLQAVRGHFRSLASYDFVFGKETSIELAIIDEDGVVQSITEQPVFGTIKDAVLPWNERFQAQSSKLPGKDILLVISDSGFSH